MGVEDYSACKLLDVDKSNWGERIGDVSGEHITFVQGTGQAMLLTASLLILISA